MKPIQLETERLFLKSVTPKFVHHLFETKSKAQIMSILGLDETGFEKYKEMHESGMETYQLSFHFFVLVEKASQLSIGECGFHTWNKKHARAELFYSLKNEEFKQRGFMKEALGEVLKFGFVQMQLHRIEALIAAWNTPSLKLVSRFGFTFEGTMKEDYFYQGKYEDSNCYALLRRDWDCC